MQLLLQTINAMYRIAKYNKYKRHNKYVNLYNAIFIWKFRDNNKIFPRQFSNFLLQKYKQRNRHRYRLTRYKSFDTNRTIIRNVEFHNGDRKISTFPIWTRENSIYTSTFIFIVMGCYHVMFQKSISLRHFVAHKNAERLNFTGERGCRTRNIIRLQIFQANNTRLALAERLLESGTTNNIISCLKSSVVHSARLYCEDETLYSEVWLRMVDKRNACTRPRKVNKEKDCESPDTDTDTDTDVEIIRRVSSGDILTEEYLAV